MPSTRFDFRQRIGAVSQKETGLPALGGHHRQAGSAEAADSQTVPLEAGRKRKRGRGQVAVDHPDKFPGQEPRAGLAPLDERSKRADPLHRIQPPAANLLAILALQAYVGNPCDMEAQQTAYVVRGLNWLRDRKHVKNL